MIIIKKYVLKQAIRGEQEKSEILSIPNEYKNIFKNLIDSLDIEYLAIPKEINLPNNDILSSKNKLSNLEID